MKCHSRSTHGRGLKGAVGTQRLGKHTHNMDETGPWLTEWSLFMLGSDPQSPAQGQCPCLIPFLSPNGLITDTWNLCFDQAQVFFSSQPNNHKLIWLLPLNINISAFACCLICLSVWIPIVTQEQVMKQNFRWSFCRGSNTVRTTFQRRWQSRCGTLRWSSSTKITGQGLKGCWGESLSKKYGMTLLPKSGSHSGSL